MRKVLVPALLVSLLACAAGSPRDEQLRAQSEASASSRAASASGSQAVASSVAVPTASSSAVAAVAPSFPAPRWPPSDQDFALVVVPLKDEVGARA